jgi:SOS-response transcriptional repressor LexA
VQTIGDRVRLMLESNRMTQTELAKKAGVTQAMVSSLVNNQQETSKRLPEIAAALGVTSDWLATGTGPKTSRLADALPVMDNSRRTWIPLLSGDEVIDYCRSEKRISEAHQWYAIMKPCSNRTFAMRVTGSSMSAQSGLSFPDGTVIYVDPKKLHSNGSFVVAQRNGSVTFKRFEQDGNLQFLVPLNPQHQSVPVDPETVILGTVIGAYFDV